VDVVGLCLYSLYPMRLRIVRSGAGRFAVGLSYDDLCTHLRHIKTTLVR